MTGTMSEGRHELDQARGTKGRNSSDFSPGQAGEEFDEFFRATYPRLIAFLVRLGASRDEADDAASQAFMTVYQRWSDIEARDAYLFAVGRQTWYRQMTRTRREIDVAPAQLWSLADPAPDRSDTQHVLGLLRRLPPGQRRVMAWSLDGYTPDEIAKILKLSVATVRSNLRHARNALKQHYQKKS